MGRLKTNSLTHNLLLKLFGESLLFHVAVFKYFDTLYETLPQNLEFIVECIRVIYTFVISAHQDWAFLGISKQYYIHI